jgi:hypothetical protein
VRPAAAAAAAARTSENRATHFWDYNVVEQVLISSAILVCLAGVMFESDRFSQDTETVFSWQRDVITYLTIIVILFSLAYYLVVIMSDFCGWTPLWLQRRCAPRKKAAAGVAADVDEIMLEMVNLPGQDQRNPSFDADIEALRRENERLVGDVAGLTKEKRKRKKRIMKGEITNTAKKGGEAKSSSARKKKNKEQFGQMKL